MKHTGPYAGLAQQVHNNRVTITVREKYLLLANQIRALVPQCYELSGGHNVGSKLIAAAEEAEGKGKGA